MKLGNDACAYFLSTGTRATWSATIDANGFHSGAAPSSLTLIPIKGDITVPDNAKDIDDTERGAGSEQHAKGLADTEITLPIDGDPANTAANTARLAFFKAANTPGATIAVALLSGPEATTGVYGSWADYIVWVDKDEPLKDKQIVKFKLRYARTAVAPERVAVA